jgi:hypothetical protein
MAGGGSRRGQNAANAAILVAIIGGLLLMYLLFLPPAERESLLFGDGSGGSYNGGTGGSGGGVFTQYGGVLIFRDTPGTLRLPKASVAEHNIPSATIFTRIQTQPIKVVDSAIVKNGVFARRDVTIEFEAQRSTTRNFLLSFNVDEAGDAPLRILLNGRLVYERPVRERSPAPVALPSDILSDGMNTLTIQSGDVGMAFWRSNAYYLRNILLSGDVIDTSNSAAAQSFSVPQEELASVESSQLQFVPECDPKKAGRLIVSLNSVVIRNSMNLSDNSTREVPNIIYSGMPDCGVLLRMDVPRETIRTTNYVQFQSDGQYIVDRIKLVNKIRQEEYPVYYFNLPREMFDTLDAGRGQLRVTLTFTDYRNVKTGEVVVNGFVQSFSTKEYVYQAVIDPGILTPGPNTIQIAPHADKLDVAELKIELV